VVKAAGATMLRGGAFKPRTSPYEFQGLGEKGLKLLAQARRETGLELFLHADYGNHETHSAADAATRVEGRGEGAIGRSEVLREGWRKILSAMRDVKWFPGGRPGRFRPRFCQ